MLDALFALLLAKEQATFKWINIDAALWQATSNHKVVRQADALDLYPNAARNLYVEQRERNRDARSLLQHAVKEAVLWIHIVVLVAVKLLLYKEHLVQGVQRGLRVDLFRFPWLTRRQFEQAANSTR